MCAGSCRLSGQVHAQSFVEHTPSNRSMAGLRMWVLGAHSAGGKSDRLNMHGDFVLRSAKESRMPSSPAKSGRRGNS